MAAALGSAGPFLAEDPYVDWADSMRHVVDRTQRRVLRAAARQAEQRGDVDAAASWWAQLIDHDPDDASAWDGVEALFDAHGRVHEAAEHRARRAARWGVIGGVAD